MEATFSFEKSVEFQRTTRRFMPEDRTRHNHRCENSNPTSIERDHEHVTLSS
jgi:hypothetical protein